MNETVQTILAFVLLAGALAFLVRRGLRRRGGPCGDGDCGCGAGARQKPRK